MTNEIAIKQGLAMLTILMEWSSLDIRSNSMAIIWSLLISQFNNKTVSSSDKYEDSERLSKPT